MRILVTGAGGFIGHHLVKRLRADGHWVRGGDVKYPEFEPSDAHEMLIGDLRSFESCARAVAGVDEVYHLAADMGGIGYISANHAQLTRNNLLIDANMLEAAHLAGVTRYLYTSSACVYPSFLQTSEEAGNLKERDAIPADPEKGYGWEKLMAEQLATYYHEDHGLDVRLVRFHNIYGPLGTYDGGKEKAPAAIMRKVSVAKAEDEIEVWGDGEQTRSFCYIDDCVEGLARIMRSDYNAPVNLGTDELVTVNELVDAVAAAAGKRIHKRHDLTKPQGVRGRNSDNSLLRELLDWEPRTTLREGLAKTYPWIWRQMDRRGAAQQPAPVETGVSKGVA
ncbi:MAG: NAD-dependent epimerase/dehydratase family protein [SAR202 cluster bacterium]|nr:NAD-dependent epimerase/dehydratase family protein [SAR202 cluster bacterium]